MDFPSAASSVSTSPQSSQSNSSAGLSVRERSIVLGFFKNSNFTEVTTICSKAAEAGDPEAMYFMGMANKLAADLKQFSGQLSYKNAEVWLQKASDAHFLKATHALGKFYSFHKNYQQALKYLSKLDCFTPEQTFQNAELTHDEIIEAHNLLGFIELFELNPPKIKEGRAHIQSAASAGWPGPNFQLAKHYLAHGQLAHATAYFQRVVTLDNSELVANAETALQKLLQRETKPSIDESLVQGRERDYKIGLLYKQSGCTLHAVKHFQISAMSDHDIARVAQSELEKLLNVANEMNNLEIQMQFVKI